MISSSHQHHLQFTSATPIANVTSAPAPASSCPDTAVQPPPLRRRRRRRQRQHQSPHPPQRQPWQHRSAAEGSLRSLLLQQSSKRLYVHPLEWTTLHLSLLCCNVIIDQLTVGHSLWGPYLEQTKTPRLQDARRALRRLLCLKAIGLRNDRSRDLITLLGLESQPDFTIDRGYDKTLGRLIFNYLLIALSGLLRSSIMENQSATFHFPYWRGTSAAESYCGHILIVTGSMTCIRGTSHDKMSFGNESSVP